MGKLSAVVLAAGWGKRMRSELPKPLHEICGVPMLAYVFELARAASAARILAVVGYRGCCRGSLWVRATLCGRRCPLLIEIRATFWCSRRICR